MSVEAIQPVLPGFALEPECAEHHWVRIKDSTWSLCAVCGFQAFFWRSRKPKKKA